MTVQHEVRARRAPVGAPDALVDVAGYNYADAFEIELPETDTRSPEAMFRTAVERASSTMRWVPVAHRYLLGLRLGPLSSPDHILGWRIVASDPDVLALEAAGPLIRGVIVGRRLPPRAVFTTYVFYVRRAPARVVWAIAAPLHRRIAPYLLELGAT